MRSLLLAPFLWLLLPATALAQGSQPPQTPPQGAPSAGKLELKLSGTYHAGKQRIAFAGQKIGIRGVVTPALAGEQVEVTIKRGKKVVRQKTLTVSGDGFQTTYRSRKRGTLTISATHAATGAQAAMDAGPLKLDL